MDSISDESSKRLKTMNCQLIPTPDQDETDCTKSLIAIQSYLDTQKVYFLLFLCIAISGMIHEKIVFSSHHFSMTLSFFFHSLFVVVHRLRMSFS